MITFSVDTNAVSVASFLGDQDRRRVAIANALNETAKDVQRAERANLSAHFIVRAERQQFMLRQAAIIKPFASAYKGNYSATIRVGQKPRMLLSTFEEGGEKTPSKGPAIAIPSLGAARPTIAQNILPDLLYKALNMHKVVSQYRGDRGTFVMENAPHGRGGVYQRQGHTLRKLYSFRPGVHLAARLNFTRVGIAVAREMWQKNMAAQITKNMNKETKALAQLFSDDSGD